MNLITLILQITLQITLQILVVKVKKEIIDCFSFLKLVLALLQISDPFPNG